MLAFLIFCLIFYTNQMKCNDSVIFEKSLVWIRVYLVKPEQDDLSCDKIIKKLSYDIINFSIMRTVLEQCFTVHSSVSGKKNNDVSPPLKDILLLLVIYLEL